MSSLRIGGVPEHFNLPFRLALESGALDPDQLDSVVVTWQDEPGGTGAMLEHLASGDLDVCSILTEGCVAAIDDGADISILSGFVASPLQWGIHTRPTAGIESTADLAGSRFAISRLRSGSHLMSFILAERLGFDLDDDSFVIVGGLDGARDAFRDGAAEVFLWDRYMTQFLVDNGEFGRVGLEETPWPSFVICARNEAVAQSPDAVAAVIAAALDQARRLHDRSDAIELLTSRYVLDAETAQAWLASTTFADPGPIDQAMLDDTLATLRRAGYVS